MNVKDRIITLNEQHTGETADIEDLLLTIVTKFQLFEPCKYLSEDDEWISVSMISLEDNNISQALNIKKGEITTWKLNTDINNIVTKAIENIQNNFYEFWENFDIKNGTENLYLDNNENIMDEMLTEELIDKEKYILDMDNYVNQEDFYSRK